MRNSPFIRRTMMALSFALLLIPAASNAQSPNARFGGKACTEGNGLYSCDFKDETGSKFLASIRLAVGQPPSSLVPEPGSPFSDVELACVCGVKGSLDDSRPLKKSSEVLCKDLDDSPSIDLVLAGVISGDPNAPTTHTFAGQLHNFNLSKGYVFDCDRVPEE